MAENPNPYQKLNSLLPADATGAFVAIQAALNQFQPVAPLFTAVVTLLVIGVIAVFLPIYAKRMLEVQERRTILFLVATFVIWSLSITSEVHYQNLFEALDLPQIKDFFVIILRVVVIFWTFLVLPLASRPIQKLSAT